MDWSSHTLLEVKVASPKFFKTSNQLKGKGCEFPWDLPLHMASYARLWFNREDILSYEVYNMLPASMIPAWSAPSLHLLYLLLLLCVLKKIKRSVLILWSNLRGRKPELSHFLNLKSKEVGAYPVSRPDRPTCTIHQQRVKEYSSRSILPCPLSPKTYPVVTFLKVSSIAMYKPQTCRLRISRIISLKGSPFDHVVVSSALYTYALSYSVRASLSFRHLINFCSTAGVICRFVDFAASMNLSCGT